MNIPHRPELEVVTLDWETYYAVDYSLTKMTTSMYVRDPRFKPHMLGVKRGESPVEVCVSERAIREALAEIDWSKAAVLAHHTQFDAFILTQQFEIVPAYYLDTLSMSRALYPHLRRHSLEALAVYFKLPQKIEGGLLKVKGVRELSPDQEAELAERCARDTELCFQLYSERMAPAFPNEEFDLVDLTVRMFTEPVLEIDLELADSKLRAEAMAKFEAMAATGVEKEDFLSNDKFADVLKRAGVSPPEKLSPATGETTWAFAKTDPGFRDLLTHDDPYVCALARARLKVKSTQGETRAARFIEEGSRGKFPVALKYWAARPGRWGGSEKMNLQNLERGGELRRSILAPKGYVVVVADSGQIEPRMVGWLADEHELLEDFRKSDAGLDRDVYCKFADKVFGRVITTADKHERFVGKVSIIQLGYGSAAPKLQSAFKNDKQRPTDIALTQCEQLVSTYRHVFAKTEGLWRTLERMLGLMSGRWQSNEYIRKPPPAMELKCLTFKGGHVVLPSGLALVYPQLRSAEDGYGYVYDDVRGAPVDIYGSKFLQNLIEALTRIVVAHQMLEIAKVHRVVMMTHDEVVAIAKESEAEACLAHMLQCMTKPLDWCPDIPLAAEGGYDVCYSK